MDDNAGAPGGREPRTVDVSDQEYGSDFVADFLKGYGFEFVAFNPGSSFRGIEESIVNYNDEVPGVVETPHEGLSVAIAHGYAKATGEPAACLLHNVVGTLHGTMGIFNAYCDRVPVVALAGTGPVRKSKRRPFYDWIHTAQIQGNLVRGYTKWDDQPSHVDGVAESLVRAINIADTRPKGPTYVALDHEIQEGELDAPIPLPDFETHRPATRIGPDPDAIDRAADLLVEADLPVLLADQVGDSREAVDALVDLAEALGAPVYHSHRLGTPHRYNFPNTHRLDLAGTDVYREADLVLALDVWSPNYTLTDVDTATHERTEAIEGEFDLVEVGTDHLRTSGLVSDRFAMRETELSVTADTALAVPALVDAVRERLDANEAARRRKRRRLDRIEGRHDEQRAAWRRAAEDAWDETPISLPRVTAEIWDVIEDEEWVLTNGTFRGWAYKLWEIDEFDQYIGSYSGGGGIGQGIGQAIGGALAYEDTDRTPINLQPDGDLMFYPGGLWTMGHYEVPMLNVVHNNGSLYNSTNHRMELAKHRGRDASFERALVGTGLYEPTPDYARIAEAMGVNGYGPVEDPDELGPVLRDAWADVQAGEPALVDVVCQPR
ncbi:MAG: thiamine pyrophosphate-binding protein [Haloferacaceae archaeon]